MNTRNWSVVVGNIGIVCNTTDEYEARKSFHAYVNISKNKEWTRAYGESVTLMVEGEPVEEFTPDSLDE